MVIRKRYLVVFDNRELGEASLTNFEDYQSAQAYADKYNSNKYLIQDYGKVHVEEEIVTRQIIENKKC